MKGFRRSPAQARLGAPRAESTACCYPRTARSGAWPSKGSSGLGSPTPPPRSPPPSCHAISSTQCSRNASPRNLAHDEPGSSRCFLESLAEADDALKRELAAYLRPYLADSPGRLLDASEKARQLGLHPDTLVKMARAGRCKDAVKARREWRFPSESVEILRQHRARRARRHVCCECARPRPET
jgi:hypothetical protein